MAPVLRDATQFLASLVKHADLSAPTRYGHATKAVALVADGIGKRRRGRVFHNLSLSESDNLARPQWLDLRRPECPQVSHLEMRPDDFSVQKNGQSCDRSPKVI